MNRCREFIIIIAIIIVFFGATSSAYKITSETISNHANNVVLTLPNDVAELTNGLDIISATNYKNGVSVCYRTTTGTVKMVAFYGSDYQNMAVYNIQKSK